MMTFLKNTLLFCWLCCWPLLSVAETDLTTLLAQVQSFQAQFSETLVVQGQKQITTGTVVIAKPNRFRWAVKTPNAQLFVADGTLLWQYEPDLAQVIVSPINQQLAMQSPLLLLSGKIADINTLYTVTRLDANHFKLTPKDQNNTLVRAITLGFSNGVLHELTLYNSLQQTTTIVFSQVILNQPIAPTVFEFTPPAGVDILHAGS